jgi:hypothetical protein
MPFSIYPKRKPLQVTRDNKLKIIYEDNSIDNNDEIEIEKVNEANEELVKALKELTKLQNNDEKIDVDDIMRNILGAQENIINHWLDKKEIDDTLLDNHVNATNAEKVLRKNNIKYSTEIKNNSLFSLFGGTQKLSKQRYTINQF